MRYAPLGVSNIAWPGADLSAALALLRDIGCDAVEVAPFNVFGRWDGIVDDTKRLRELLERHGLVCSAMQGILYNVPDVEMFMSNASRDRLQQHLERVAALAEMLGVKACVFGAPKQRDPGNLAADEAWSIAVAALRRAGPAFAQVGSALAVEANARRYGCRFVTTTAEAVRLVADVGQPGIGLQIDTGTLFLEGEPLDVLSDAAPHAVHAHVSEPDLLPPGGLDHRSIAAALQASGYVGSLSVEMKQTADWQAAIPAAVSFVRTVYA